MNKDAPSSQQDDGLEWLREIRRQMSAEANHDTHTYLERLRALQQLPQFSRRLVRVRKVLEPVSAK
jgi:hypothetical protein